MAEIQVVLFNLNQNYMNKKSIKLNSANIISIRKNLDVTINKYWKIIRAENLMSKKAVAAKQGSGLDLKSLYNQIMQMTEKIAKCEGVGKILANGSRWASRYFLLYPDLR